MEQFSQEKNPKPAEHPYTSAEQENNTFKWVGEALTHLTTNLSPKGLPTVGRELPAWSFSLRSEGREPTSAPQLLRPAPERQAPRHPERALHQLPPEHSTETSAQNAPASL